MITGILMALLIGAYIFLKISNTNAKLAEKDAMRAAEAEAARQAAEEAEEEEQIRAEAIDVEAEVIGEDAEPAPADVMDDEPVEQTADI